jgi:hypothetical protein
MSRVEHEPMPANSPMWAWLRRPFGVPIEAVAVAAAAIFVVIVGLDVGKDVLQAPIDVLDEAGSRGSPSSSYGQEEDKGGEVAAPVPAPQEQQLDPQGDLDNRYEPPTGTANAEPELPARAKPSKSTQARDTGTPEPKEVETKDGTAEPKPAASTSSGTTTSQVTLPTSGIAFQIRSTDPAYHLELVRKAAARYGGVLHDDEHQALNLDDAAHASGGRYYIQLQSDNLRAFAEALESIGAISNFDGSKFSPTGTMQVELVIMHVDPSTGKKAAPSKRK